MNSYFSCETPKSPISYNVGETVIFDIEYLNEGKITQCPYFKWEVSGDFGLNKEGITSGESGKIRLDAKLDKPGFIFVKVIAVDENGNQMPESDIFYGGAGVELENVRSVTPRPDDYDKFWEDCKKEMNSVYPKVLEMEKLSLDEQYPNHDIYDVKIDCFGNAPVSGILSIPKDGKKHPCRVVYQGYGVKTCWINADDNEIQMCINAHGIKNNQPQEYYDELANGRLNRYGFNPEENKSPYTCYFKNMMIRAGQALRFMMTLDEWDGENLGVRGGSQGAVQSLHASFLIPQVNDIFLFVPWLCDTSAANIGRKCGWGEFEFVSTPYFDLTNRAKTIKAPVYIEAGLGDYTAPPAGVVSMYNNLETKKTLVLIQGKEHIYESPASKRFIFE